MKFLKSMLVVVAAAACAASLLTLISAQGRTWSKFHWRVTDQQNNPIVEYVQIQTQDGNLSPHIESDLIQLSSGEYLILNSKTHSKEEWARTSLKRVGGEVLLATDVTAGSQGRVVLCGTALELPDDSQATMTSKAVRKQAKAAFGKCSQEDQVLLERIAEVGLALDPVLYGQASILHQLLFPDLVDIMGGGGNRMIVSKVYPFDPNQIPPSEFEKAFGEAYSRRME